MTNLRNLSQREFHLNFRAWPPWIGRRRVEVLIGLGIFLRVAQYLANRSYWLDEASLAGNIRTPRFLDLFGPLSHTQLAPPGFLAVEWVALKILGDNPFALRLLPLLGGIASLFLLRRLASQVVCPGAVAIAVALFAFSDDQIYFSSELKQYSTDVTIGLMCTLLGLSIRQGSPSRLVGLAVFGAVAVWFSHAAAFVLAGIGTVLFTQAIVHKKYRYACWLVLVGAIWVGSIVVLRMVSLRQLDHRLDMWAFWSFAFPQWPLSASSLAWPVRRCLYLLVNPLDFYWPLRPGFMILLPTLLGLVGFGSLLRRKPAVLALLVMPGVFALSASYLHLFPFHGRLVLFLVPAILLVIAEGAGWTCQKVGNRWFQIPLLAALLAFPILGDVYHLAVSRERSGINPFGDRRPYPGSIKHPGFHPDHFLF